MTITTLQYNTPDGLSMKSHLCLPENTSQKQPAVLVFPEWWGLSEHAKKSAESLAKEGYVALAVDMYGDAFLTDNAQYAAEKMNDALSNHHTQVRAKAALLALSRLPMVDSKRIAAIGYCFGGGVVLNMARWGEPIVAAVSFHGNLLPFHQKAAPNSIQAALLVEHAEKDTMMTMSMLDEFRAEMTEANARYHVDVFPEAKHGFTNPKATENGLNNQLDLAYHAESAQQSWQNMLSFLKQTLF